MHDAQSADRWAILELRHRYMRSVDLKDWAAVGETLAPEMVARYRPDLATEGADALLAELRTRLTDDRITVHQVGNPSIEIDGDRAAGTWTVSDRTVCTDVGCVVEGASLSTDRYRRDPRRGWLITEISYRRLCETSVSLADLPSFRVLATPATGLALS
ncbi:nuclear transport factor 2 family protein [Nocardioides sp. R1-1]|uniref:nuclear transport factor 2 family protein n=1 Tax=Nocardioides sp. R1-1 TaxID=3383502 RepID=UPI0038D10855